MSDTVVSAARDVAVEWKQEAENRRKISKHDPVADTLDHCAEELLEHLRVVDGPGAMRSVEQYAQDYGVSPQSVRNWIHRGQLEATKTAHGWMIPRTARRRRGDDEAAA